MKVYVVTTGQATYEDQVKVIGVYTNYQEAVNRGMQESLICRDGANWGNYWYDVEEWEVV
jgi:hypothetical protein